VDVEAYLAIEKTTFVGGRKYVFFASRLGKGYKIKSGCILSKADSILIMGCQNYRLTIKNYRLVT
jgi:hypothetical protein